MAAVQSQAELLDGGHDHLVGVVLGEQSADQGAGVGVGLDTALLKLVEFLPRLAIQVLAIYHKEALVDVGVIFEEGGSLEGGQGLTAAGGVPDVAIPSVLVNAVHNGLHGIDLIGPHHQEFLFARDQDHVAADHLSQGALGQKSLGEVVQLGYWGIVHGCELIQGQKTLIGVESKVATVVVGEVPGLAAVADDEQLQETEQGLGVAVAGIVLVLDDLLDGPTRADGQGLEFNLDHGHAIKQKDHVITMMTVVGIDPQLVDHFKSVLAPVLDVDEGVVERCPIVPLEAVALSEHPGGSIHVRGHDGVQ